MLELSVSHISKCFGAHNNVSQAQDEKNDEFISCKGVTPNDSILFLTWLGGFVS